MRLLAVVSGFVAGAAAQLSGWSSDQVNTTICYWGQLRGIKLFQSGVILTLNFSIPFNTSQNISALFGQLNKGPEGSGAGNLAPNYVDGALLSNDHEMFLFGGALANTDSYTPPDDKQVFYYRQSQYGVNRTFFSGFGFVDLPSGSTRYITYGGAANAPSENKAWYFSGMRSPDWGAIYQTSANQSVKPSNISNTLFTLDMTTQQGEFFENRTLTGSARGRASPELVWVPVGEQGILVAIGGVVYPDFVTTVHQSSNATASKAQSPEFMTTIDVYDVFNKTWYQQTTTGGGPGQLALACSVLATAADASSFNIYLYGGYDGLAAFDDYSDDVWVLSLPSFTWTQVFAGNTSHGRAGHRCLLPYPDQMFVVGGSATMSETEPCAEGGILQVFNLSSTEWLTSYNPEKWSNYTVPDAVVKVIGGNGQGGATATEPAVSGGWDTAALGAVFSTAYKTSIPTYYPYSLATTTTSGTNSTSTAVPTPKATGSHGSKVPSFLPPLLGVICGLMALSLCVLGFVLYRRRALLRRGSQSGGRRSSRGVDGARSDATYDTRANMVINWLLGITSVKRSPTTTGASAYSETLDGTTGSPSSPEMEQLHGGSPRAYHASGSRSGTSDGSRHLAAVEVPDTAIAEMMADTHHPVAELSGESSSAGAASSRFGRGEKVVSFVSSAAELESTTDSRRHGRRGSAVVPAVIPEAATARPDSPPLSTAGLARVYLPPSRSGSVGLAPTPPISASAPTPSSPSTESASPGVGSGSRRRQRESSISELSDSDRRHLRQGSEGGDSVNSGTSSLVSPSTPQTAAAIPVLAGAATMGRPHPIPEAAAAEEAAEAETATGAGAGPQTNIPPPSLIAQQSAPVPPSPGGSLGTLRRSIFRESEEDMSG
ncbi:hypothetical protein CMQ_3102 [Grosmannia clavigera kw1407]|uniref:Kelch repeat protein n=1 Tax=Grosmannia clavigera (strain kw1407 / UAMH 11150) TaxID=655863 RepID=F0XGV1_GROCL|nr:uncharacterized protein CMQ_3102 [Grosmannia clavigera kw1407]EFX03173.1 hypothetical protein CMQ_3102 [Grosmannia clavigera kw1407]